MLTRDQIHDLCTDVADGMDVKVAIMRFGITWNEFRLLWARGLRDRKVGYFNSDPAIMVSEVNKAAYLFQREEQAHLVTLMREDYKSIEHHLAKTAGRVENLNEQTVAVEVDREELIARIKEAAKDPKAMKAAGVEE